MHGRMVQMNVVPLFVYLSIQQASSPSYWYICSPCFRQDVLVHYLVNHLTCSEDAGNYTGVFTHRTTLHDVPKSDKAFSMHAILHRYIESSIKFKSIAE